MILRMRSHLHLDRPRRGFTLAEVTVALAIMAILAAVSWISYKAVITLVQDRKASIELKEIEHSTYFTNIGVTPFYSADTLKADIGYLTPGDAGQGVQAVPANGVVMFLAGGTVGEGGQSGGVSTKHLEVSAALTASGQVLRLAQLSESGHCIYVTGDSGTVVNDEVVVLGEGEVCQVQSDGAPGPENPEKPLPVTQIEARIEPFPLTQIVLSWEPAGPGQTDATGVVRPPAEYYIVRSDDGETFKFICNVGGNAPCVITIDTQCGVDNARTGDPNYFQSCGGDNHLWTVEACSGSVCSLPSDPVTPAEFVPGDAGLTIEATPTSVTLSWTIVNADNTPVDGFQVFRSEGVGSSPVNQWGQTEGARRTFLDTDVVAGETLCYAVAGYNGAGVGAKSDKVCVKVPAIPKLATPQATVTAADSALTVRWSAIDQAKAYALYLNGTLTATVPGTTEQYTITGLTNGRNYVVQMVAVGFYGQQSDASEGIVGVPIAAKLVAPTHLAAAPASTLVSLTWDAVPGAAKYRVFLDGVGYTTVTSPSAIITGLSNGMAYAFSVAAIDDYNQLGFQATPINATPSPAGGGVPWGVSALPADSSLIVNWSKVPSATAYKVYLDGVLKATVNDPLTTTTVTGLVNGHQYVVAVTSVNGGDVESAFSGTVSATPLPPVPAVPSNIRVLASDGTATLTWSPVAGLTYEVTRSSGGAPVVSNVTGGSFIQSSLVNGTTYGYQLRAVDVFGQKSMYSTPVYVTPLPAPLEAPTNIVATPMSSKYRLNWSPVTGAVNYIIYERQLSGSWLAVRSTPYVTSSNLQNEIEMTATNGVTYTVTVGVQDKYGQVTMSPTGVRVTPLAAKPIAPVLTTVRSHLVYGGGSWTDYGSTPPAGSLYVVWGGVAGATTYRVYVNGFFSAAVPASGSSISTILGPLTNGAVYSIQVTAVDSMGQESDVSNTMTGMPMPNRISAPVNVQGSYTPAGDVTITWSGVAGASKYWVSGAGNPVSTTGLSKTFTGLTLGTTYNFSVQVEDAYGVYSVPATVAVRPLPAKPATPTNLAAQSNSHVVTLTWDPVPGAAGYQVVSNGQRYGLPVTTNYHTVRNLTNGSEYTFEVIAVDSWYQESAPSTSVKATPLPAPPAPPYNVSATAGVSSVYLTWTSSSADYTYEIYLDGATTPAKTVAQGQTIATLDGLVNNQKYSITVVAVDQYNQKSDASVTVESTPKAESAFKPSNVGVAPSDGSIHVTWTGFPEATKYLVTYVAPGVDPVEVNAGTTTSVTLNNLVNGKLYTIEVTAISPAGTLSAPSVTARPLPAALAAPTGVSAQSAPAALNVSWNAVPGALNYYVLLGGVVKAVTTDTSVTVNGLTNGFPYQVQVEAVDQYDQASLPSLVTIGVPLPARPPAPAYVQAVGGTQKLEVRWGQVSEAYSYNIYLNGQSPTNFVVRNATGEILGVNGTPATPSNPAKTLKQIIGGLPVDTGYLVTVTAVDQFGQESLPSVEASAATYPALLDGPTTIQGTASSGRVQLTWSAVAGAIAYQVYANGQPCTSAPANYAGNTGYFTCPAIGYLQNGTAYVFRIAAVDPMDQVGTLSTASVTLRPLPSAPAGPITVTATPGDRSVALSWANPVDNGNHAVSYKVFVDGAEWPNVTQPDITNLNNVTVRGLTNGVTYSFQVAGVDLFGQLSDLTNPVTATPSAVPIPAPGNLQLVSAVNTSATITWDPVPGAVSYRVSKDGVMVPIEVNRVTYTFTGLTTGANVTLGVAAVDANGQLSTYSTVIARPLPAALNSVSNPTVVPGDSKLTISWDRLATATSYRVVANGDPTSLATASQVPSGRVTAVVNGLTNGQVYSLLIYAVDAYGQDGLPRAVSGMPVADPLAAPVLSGNAGPEQVSLSWTAIQGAVVYQVFRDGVLYASTAATSYNATGLTDGVERSWTVKAVDSFSQPGAVSNALLLRPTPPIPATPTNVFVSPSDSTLTVTWDGMTGASQYHVYLDGVLKATVSSPAATLTGLTNGVTYSVQVDAANTINDTSAKSAPIDAIPAPIPPAQPRNVTITYLSPTSARISWSAAARAANYTVNLNGTDWVTVNAPATTADVTGLTTGAYYTGYVIAHDAYGQASTASTTFTVRALPTPLTAPTGLTATPGNATATASWNNLDGAVQYKVNGLGVDSTTATNSKTVVGLTNDQTYFVRVAGIDQFGQQGAWSSYVEVTPMPAAPEPPTNIQVTYPTGTSATLTWTAGARATRYQVYVDDVAVAGGTATATTQTLSNLTTGRTYTVKIQSIDSKGRSGLTSYSTPVDIRPVPALLAPPANVTTLPLDSAATVSWDVRPGAAIYTVYVNALLVGTVSSDPALTEGRITYDLTGLTNGTTYQVQVSATDQWSVDGGSSRESVPSLPVSVRPLPAPLAAPLNLTVDGVSDLGTSAALTWDAVTAATKYNVYVNNVLSTSVVAPATEVTVNNLVKGSTVSFKVVAVDAFDQEGLDATVSVRILPAVPTPPTNPSAVSRDPNHDASLAQLMVSWTNPVGVDVQATNIYLNGVLAIEAVGSPTYLTGAAIQFDLPVTVELSTVDIYGRESVRTLPLHVTPSEDLPLAIDPASFTFTPDSAATSAVMSWAPVQAAGSYNIVVQECLGVSPWGCTEVLNVNTAAATVTLHDLKPYVEATRVYYMVDITSVSNRGNQGATFTTYRALYYELTAPVGLQVESYNNIFGDYPHQLALTINVDENDVFWSAQGPLALTDQALSFRVTADNGCDYGSLSALSSPSPTYDGAGVYSAILETPYYGNACQLQWATDYKFSVQAEVMQPDGSLTASGYFNSVTPVRFIPPAPGAPWNVQPMGMQTGMAGDLFGVNVTGQNPTDPTIAIGMDYYADPTMTPVVYIDGVEYSGNYLFNHPCTDPYNSCVIALETGGTPTVAYGHTYQISVAWKDVYGQVGEVAGPYTTVMPPVAPANVIVGAPDSSAWQLGSLNIPVTWDVTPTATNYSASVYHCPLVQECTYQEANSNGWMQDSYSPTDPSILLTNLDAGAWYALEVNAQTTGSWFPSPSTYLVFQALPPAPAAPTGLTAIPLNGGTALHWDDMLGAENYRILVDGVLNKVIQGTGQGGTLSTTVMGLTNGQEYTISIVAVDGYGQESSPATTPVTPVEVSQLPAPVVSAWGVHDGLLTASWLPVEGASSTTGYRVVLTDLSAGGTSMSCDVAYDDFGAAVATRGLLYGPQVGGQMILGAQPGMGYRRLYWADSVLGVQRTGEAPGDTHCTFSDPAVSPLTDTVSVGRDFQFSIQALDPSGNAGVPFVQQAAGYTTAPQAPTDVVATVGELGGMPTIITSWTGSESINGVDRYSVRVDGAEVTSDFGENQGVGPNHSVTLNQLGTWWSWGSNTGRQGVPGSAAATLTTPVGVMDYNWTYIQMARSGSVTCGLKADGSVQCWGAGYLNGKSAATTSPATVAGITGATRISVNKSASCALKSNGTVWCWGTMSSVGSGVSTGSTSVPTQVAGLTDVVDISGGGGGGNLGTDGGTTCAVLSSGMVACWGGYYSVIPSLTGGNETRPSFAKLSTGAYVQGAVKVYVGTSDACAVKVDGSVVCWGAGTITATAMNGLKATDVTVGESHACAILTDSSMRCWGSNGTGQLGNNTTTASPGTPVTPNGMGSGVVDIAAFKGYNASTTGTTCAIKNDGSVYCWGYNGSYHLGDGTTTQRNVPTLLSSVTSAVAFADNMDGGVTVRTAKYGVLAGQTHNVTVEAYDSQGLYSPVSDVATLDSRGPSAPTGMQASNTTVGILPGVSSSWTSGVTTTPLSRYLVEADGVTRSITASPGLTNSYTSSQFQAWGTSGNNQARDGLTTAVAGQRSPAVMLGSDQYLQVVGGNGFSCALRTDTKVECWGLGTSGQLGNGASATSTTPVLVQNATTAITGVASIAAGSTQACALFTNGSVSCWGTNADGQLGTGDKVALTRASNVSSVFTNAAKVVTSGRMTCIVTTNSHLKCAGYEGNSVWGVNGYDPGLTNVKDVSVSTNHMCVLLTDGSVKCDGNNANGQLGNGTVNGQGFPNPTTPITSGAVSVAVTVNNTCVVMNTGAIKCWGNNTNGATGVGATTGNTLSPASLGSVNNAVKVTAGQNSFCALLSNGTVKCWGYGGTGSIGNGAVTDATTPQLVTGLTGAFDIEGAPAGASAGTMYARVNTSTIIPGTTYAMSVRTVDAFGQVSPASTSTNLSVPLPAAPATPPGLTVTPTTRGNLPAFNLAWTAPATAAPGSTYQVTLNGTPVTTSTYPQTTAGIYSWGVAQWGAISSNIVKSPTTYSGFEDVAQFSTGTTNSPCVVMTDGTVQCLYSDTLQTVGGISSVTQVSASGSTTCALKSDGTVWCWGTNDVGQVGNGTTAVNASTPVVSPSQTVGITTAVQVATGANSSCALLADTTVKCWGYNATGQLGNGLTGSLSANNVPLTVPGLTGVAKVAVGDGYACALMLDTTVKCWGRNLYGNLGLGNTTQTPRPTTVPGLSTVTQLSLGTNTSCAVLADATIKCWGYNTYGQVGDGTSANNKTSPTTTTGISNASNVFVGNNHTCAILTNSTVKCWGYGTAGAIGNGTQVNSPTPVAVTTSAWAVKSMVLGTTTTRAMVDFKTLTPDTQYTLGVTMADPYGQSSTQATATATTPATASVGQVSNLALTGTTVGGLPAVGASWTAPANFPAWSSYKVTVGTYSPQMSLAGSSSFLDANRATVAWGTNENSTATADGSVSARTQPQMVGSGSLYTQVSGSCGLRVNGTVWCWGTNTNGELGDNTTVTKTTPVQVTGITTATQVTSNYSHVCALLADTTVKCWGLNSNGQLGDNSTTQRLVPVAVSGLTGATQISAGGTHTCAVLNTGSVKCWGANSFGQLGNASSTPSSVPVTVANLTTATQVSSGALHTCARTSDGSGYCWGYNGSGQLGDGLLVNLNTPVAVASLTGVSQIAAGQLHSCALINDGTMKCWGDNSTGQIGDATGTRRPAPTPVSGVTTATQIAASAYGNCVLLSSGAGKCWGMNNSGEVGDGTANARNVPTAIFSPPLTSVPANNTSMSTTPVTVIATANLGLVAANTQYTVTVTPVDIFGNVGTPVSANVTTAP